jgi:hypothetical protein
VAVRADHYDHPDRGDAPVLGHVHVGGVDPQESSSSGRCQAAKLLARYGAIARFASGFAKPSYTTIWDPTFEPQ